MVTLQSHPAFPSLYFFLILCLATWRLSSLLVSEKGPFNLFSKIRHVAGIREGKATNVIAEGLQCIWCTSIWVGTVLTLFYALLPALALWLSLPLALSTIAIILNSR